MKIEEEPVPATSSSYADMPPASSKLLLSIRLAKTHEEFIATLNKGRELQPVMGKTELCRWVPVLNRCDEVLGRAVEKNEHGQMKCDYDERIKRDAISVIRFTSLLFECTSSRRVYRSLDNILYLMDSADMEMLAEVLRLLQTMGKRSKFLTQRLNPADQNTLVHSLTAIAQCWGGKLRSVKMAECMKREPKLPQLFPFLFTDGKNRQVTVEKPKPGQCVAEIVDQYMAELNPAVPAPQSSSSTSNEPAASPSLPAYEDRYCLLSRIRMLNGFDSLKHRFRCLVVRLLAVSTLIYCRCQSDENPVYSLLYAGFVEELVALLKTERESNDNDEYAMLDSLHAESLATLTAVVSLERDPKVTAIVAALSAGSYHGYLSVLTRNVVDELKKNQLGHPGKPSISLATSLFSFIYHLASVESKGAWSEALVGSGLTQTLLSVIDHHKLPLEMITYGTRCARIIDLFTTIEVTAFRNHNGMDICVNRIVHEINECRKEQPFMIDVSGDHYFEDGPPSHQAPPPPAEGGEQHDEQPMETSNADETVQAIVVDDGERVKGGPWIKSPATGLTCHQQRSGLIKGLLTFVKRAIQDTNFTDSIRHIMEGGLPEALMHILSNAEYYSPSLFHQSAQLITNYVYQNPGELSVLQRRHVPYVLFQSMLRKELPNSRDVISNIGNVFTAMCINERGLEQFKSYEPFEQIFRILLSVKFLVTMKKKRTEMTETAHNIGTALDDLLRHYPTLKTPMLKAVHNVLDKLIELGNRAPENTDIVMALAKQVARNVSLSGHNRGDASTTGGSATASLSPQLSAFAPEAARPESSADNAAQQSRPASSQQPQPEQRSPAVRAADGALSADEQMMLDEIFEDANDEEESDEDEEAELSMDEMSGEGVVSTTPIDGHKSGGASRSPEARQTTAEDMGLDMHCDDGTGSGRRLLPLGDYMLIATKIFETLMTQQSAIDMVEKFIEDKGVDKLLALCQLPSLNHEIAQSTLPTSIANIIRFVVFQRNTRMAHRLMQSVINAFTTTLKPLIRHTSPSPPVTVLLTGDTPTSTAVTLRMIQNDPPETSAEGGEGSGDHSPRASMMMHLGEKVIVDTLTNLNNMLPVLNIISKCTVGGQFQADMRNRVFETWNQNRGRELYRLLRSLSRMLVWESSLIRVLKPSIRTCATQTDPGELMRFFEPENPLMANDPLKREVAFLPEVEADSMERSEPKQLPWIAAGISQEENDFWAQHKHLAELVVKTSRQVSDMLNLVSRSLNMMSRRRTRRPHDRDMPVGGGVLTDAAGKLATYIFECIYKDVKWVNAKGPQNTQMEYARCTELLMQMSTALFDERGRAANTGIIQRFYQSGCHKAFFDLLTERLVPALDKDLPAGLQDVLIEWCNLAERLANKANMTAHVDERYGGRERNVFNGEFDLNKYLKLVYRDMFNAFTMLFEKLSSVGMSDLTSFTYLSEKAIEVFKDVARNLNEDSEASETRGAAPAPEEPAPQPDQEEERILSLMDLGFSREEVLHALAHTRNTDEAAEYLLSTNGAALMAELNMMRNVAREAQAAMARAEGAIDADVEPQRARREALPEETFQVLMNGAAIHLNLNGEIEVFMVDPDNEQNQNALRAVTGNDYQMTPDQRQRLYARAVESGVNDNPNIRGTRVFLGGNPADDPAGTSAPRTPSPVNVEVEDDIASPLVPPLKELKIEQDISLQAACIQLMPLCKRLMQLSSDLVYSCADLMLVVAPAMAENWKKDVLIEQILIGEVMTMCDKVLATEDIQTELETLSKIGNSLNPTEGGMNMKNLSNRLHFACLLFDKFAEEYIDATKQHKLVEKLLSLVGYCEKRWGEGKQLQTLLLSPTILWLDLYDKNSRTITRRKTLESIAPVLSWAYVTDEPTDNAGPRRRERKWIPFEQPQQKQITDAFYKGNSSVKIVVKRYGRPDRSFEVDFATMKQTEVSAITGGQRMSVSVELPDDVDIDWEKFIAQEKAPAWSHEENARLLILLVHLLQKNVIHHLCAHSILNFVARLTRVPENATQFFEAGGVEQVLRLKCTTSSSSSAILSIIIRNCIDDDVMLSQVFEKTLRNVASVHNNPYEYITIQASKPKDWYEVLNRMMPLSSRNPSVFASAIEKTVKLNGCTMSVVPSSHEKKEKKDERTASTSEKTEDVEKKERTSSMCEAPKTNTRATSIVSMLLNDVLYGEFPTDVGVGQGRMLMRSGILSVLAELVRSYPVLANTVCEAQANNGQSILHTLMEMYMDAPVDKVDTSSAMKTLIATIASCNNAPKAQESLVNDVKSALQTFCDKALLIGKEEDTSTPPPYANDPRAMILFSTKNDEESVARKISELCTIVTWMCEACPSPPPTVQQSDRPNAPRHINPPQPNHIMKLFHKKKISNDLVRAITFLKLSKKEAIDAVNEILKTLEVLMKGLGVSASSATHATGQSTGGAALATTNGERTVGRMEVSVTTDGARVRNAHEDIADDVDDEEEDGGREDEEEDGWNDTRDARQMAERVEALAQILQRDRQRWSDQLNDQPHMAQEDEEEGSEVSESSSESEDNDDDDDENEGEERMEGDAIVRDDAVETANGDVRQPLNVDAPAGEDGREEAAADVDIESIESEDREDEDMREDNEEQEDEDRDDEDREVEEAMQDAEEQGAHRVDDEEEEEEEEEEGDSMEEDQDDFQFMEDNEFHHGIESVRNRIRMIETGYQIMGRDRGPPPLPFGDLLGSDDWGVINFRAARGERDRNGLSLHSLLSRPTHNTDDASARGRIAMTSRAGDELASIPFMPRTALQRQNAIRREDRPFGRMGLGSALDAAARVARNHDGVGIGAVSGRGVAREHINDGHLLDRILELGAPSVLYPRPLRTLFVGDGIGNEEDRVRSSHVSVSSCLERLQSYVNIMEPISVRYICVIVNTLVTRRAKKREIKEKEANEEKKKKEVSAAKSKADAVSLSRVESTSSSSAQPVEQATVGTATQEASASVTAQIGSGQEEQVVVATPSATGTTNSVVDTTAVAGETTETVGVTTHEPMDTGTGASSSTTSSDQATAPAAVAAIQGIEPEPMEVGDDDSRLPHSSAATAASSVGGEDPDEESAPNEPAQPQEPPARAEPADPLGGLNVVEFIDQAIRAPEQIDQNFARIQEFYSQRRQTLPRGEFDANMDEITAEFMRYQNMERGQNARTLIADILRALQDGPLANPAPVPVPAPEPPPPVVVEPEVEQNRPEPVVEEFRAILGDIEIPDGVDPAFLAALPEDMRAEVIRDYQRQQRAERAARPPPVVEAAAAVAAVVEGDAVAAEIVNAAAPLVEPINQEFLNALPPELQEEVLAEHERAVREAQEAIRRAAAPPAPEPEMDGAAVIASLPANERAQVLAEMDEAELAGLPQAMQDEARRARQQHIDPHVLRYHRLLFRGQRNGRAPAANQGPTVGQYAGTATQANPNAGQLLDRDAVLTLCMLYLVDGQISYAKLQKVLRNACVNSSTCDFVVWCLLALLDKASEEHADDEEIISKVPEWLESITVSGVGHNERAIRISEGATKVSIHSMLSVPLCRNILELLAIIAKAYPGNFLPVQLRTGTKGNETTKEMPGFEHFWHMVQTQKAIKVPPRRDSTALPEEQLDECPVGHLLGYLQKPTISKTLLLSDKLMKVASTIMQTVPHDALKKMQITNEQHLPMQKQLKLVVEGLTKSLCSNEGLADGLALIVESMRAFNESTADFVYEHLFKAVADLGKELEPQITRLITELDEVQKEEDSQTVTPQMSNVPSSSNMAAAVEGEASSGTEQQGTSASVTSGLVVVISESGRVARGRFDGQRLVIDGEQNSRLMMGASSCKELQLPAVTSLTDKTGAQYTLLTSLQTLVKVRSHMRQIRIDKKKREKEEREKSEKKADGEEGTVEGSVEATARPQEGQQDVAAHALANPAAEQRVATSITVVRSPQDQQASSSAATAAEPVAGSSQGTSKLQKEESIEIEEEVRLSQRLESLNPLWDSLSECLHRLGKASDPHAVLALQPAAEAFFLVHAPGQQKKKDTKEEAAKRKESRAQPVASTSSHDALSSSIRTDEMDPDTAKLIEFAEKHRQVLNQALRQNNAVLSSGGPFAILTQYPKLLDFDVKRKYFRKELNKLDHTSRYRRQDVSVQVNRSRVFSDSFRELFRLRPSDWKNRFYIIFQGEEGQDAGGLLREWFAVITREIFNPNYALFITAPGDMVTYMINKASYINPEHLDYFKFVGRLIAKSVFEHKYLDCYFTRAFYKHILNLPVKYQDLESEDPAFFKSLEFLLTNPIDDLGLDLTFSTEVEEFGVRSVRDLKPDGRKIEVTDANKEEYVKLVCQMKMTGSIRKQLDAFLTGFYEIIPKELISMFNEQELELLISGLPTVDVDDLAANTEYKGYSKTSVQIQWFWRALRSFEKEDKAKFLQFVTGTSKVPLQGFSSLEGMNGVQRFSVHMDSRGGDRLPAAHTCFNQLDLPQYDSYEKLRDALLLAIRECTEGFGFA